MNAHDNIVRIAAKAFNEHVMHDAPTQSWFLGKPGTSTYAFSITWSPGILCVSGDVGRGVFEHWRAFATLAGSVDLVTDADFDYLCEKSGFAKEFDREATAEHLIEGAYQNWRCGGRPQFFDQVCDEYGGDVEVVRDRKEAVRAFRRDCDLTAERVYRLTGDCEDPLYRYPAAARWAFEAVKLWAAKMRAAVPAMGEAA